MRTDDSDYEIEYDRGDDSPPNEKKRSGEKSAGENSAEEIPPVEIPLGQLSAEAVSGVIEAFVLREGTDYGASEVSLEEKIQQVRNQLKRGDVRIVYDPNSESVTLMTEREWQRWAKK